MSWGGRSLLEQDSKGWNREVHYIKLSFLFSFKDKKEQHYDSKSICHLQISRTDVESGINRHNPVI